MTTLEQLEVEIRRLSSADRSRLMDHLIESLEADRAVDDAWDAEAAARDAEIEAGTSSVVDTWEVIARLRAEPI